MRFRVADWFKAIIVVSLVVVVWYFARAVTTTIFIFAMGAVLAFLIAPVVDSLVLKGVYRAIAVIITYAALVALFALALFFLIPFIIKQLQSFAQLAPHYFDTVRVLIDRVFAYLRYSQFNRFVRQIPVDTNTLINQASSLVTDQIRNIVGLIPSLITLVSELVLVVIISAYLLYYLPHLDRTIRSYIPEEGINLYLKFIETTKTGLRRYIFGQLALMIVIGVLAGVGMWILGVPYALLLGVWAGLTEMIPYLGPFLGAVPAVLLALTIKPIYALWVILIYVAVQQLESVFLSPVILGESIGVSPILIAFAITAGAELGGVIGALIAVPILVILQIIFRFFREHFKYIKNDVGPDEIVPRENS
jgi:predicted PurR-regulated permease PerM